MIWLVPLAAVVVVAIIIWHHRRKAAARESQTEARLKAFLSDAGKTDGAGGVARPEAYAAPDAMPVPQASHEINLPITKEYTARAALLTPPQKVLYYLLKAQLSDHEVLTKISAVAVLDIPTRFSGFERETRERRLALTVLDFVVCDKSFKAVAVVQCRTAQDGDATHLAFAQACCTAVGLRWVEIVTDALPARETVRGVVLGA